MSYLSLVKPSRGAIEIPPGSNVAGAIESALASSHEEILFIPGGDYEVERAINFASFIPAGMKKRLVCPGGMRSPARIVPTYEGSGGLDARTNAVFKLRGVVSETSTTTAGKIYRGQPTGLLTAGIGSAGQWVRIQGVNPQADFLYDSSTAIVSEIIEIASRAGTTLTFQEAALIWHSSGLSAQLVTPVLDVTIEGLFFDCDGNDTIACALQIEDAARIALWEVGWRNVARAGVSGYGSKHVNLWACYSRGSSNSGVYRETCQDFNVWNYTRFPEGARYHPASNPGAAIPRPELAQRAMCAACVDDGAHIQRANGVIRFWGGAGPVSRNGFARDINSTKWLQCELVMQPTYGIVATGGTCIDGGPGPTGPGEDHAEFAIDPVVENWTFEDCYQEGSLAAGYGGCAFYYHDWFPGARVSGISLANYGRGPLGANAAGYWCGGIILSDFTGEVGDHQLHGCEFAVLTRNVVVTTKWGTIEFRGLQGDGGATVAAFTLQLDHENGTSSGRSPMRISRLLTGSAPYQWCRFGPSFAANPDYTFTIDEAVIEGYPFENVRPMATGAGINFGTVCSYAAGAAATSVAAGARNLGAYASTDHNGFAMVATRKATIAYSGAAPVLGDSLVQGALGIVAVAAIPASPASYMVCDATIVGPPAYVVASFIRQ